MSLALSPGCGCCEGITDCCDCTTPMAESWTFTLAGTTGTCIGGGACSQFDTNYQVDYFSGIFDNCELRDSQYNLSNCFWASPSDTILPKLKCFLTDMILVFSQPFGESTIYTLPQSSWACNGVNVMNRSADPILGCTFPATLTLTPV